MALILSEAAKLSNDMVQRGVIETLVKESPILGRLPFLSVEGNSYRYNQEAALGFAEWHAIGDTWTESSSAFSAKTANLTILGGDVDIDNFIQQTRSDVNDQRAIQVSKKAKAVAQEFETQVISGDGTANRIEGLAKWYSTNAGVRTAPDSQVMLAGENGGDLSTQLMDELIDRVFPGKPDALIMPRRTRRKLKQVLAESSHYLEVGGDEFGRQVMMYDGIPVLVSDYIPENETQGSGTGLSSIYAVTFGAGEALCGLQNGAISVENLGRLETKDATRVRIKWYVGLACFNMNRCARLAGIAG